MICHSADQGPLLGGSSNPRDVLILSMSPFFAFRRLPLALQDLLGWLSRQVSALIHML